MAFPVDRTLSLLHIHQGILQACTHLFTTLYLLVLKPKDGMGMHNQTGDQQVLFAMNGF